MKIEERKSWSNKVLSRVAKETQQGVKQMGKTVRAMILFMCYTRLDAN